MDKDVFQRDGFLVFDPELPEATLDGAVADAERRFPRPDRWSWLPFRATVSPPGSERSSSERFQDAWSTSENVRNIALSPATLALLGDLYGREPRPFQTLNFRIGSQQRPHSDAVHSNTQPRGLMCAVWVALEDIDMDNGPLALYPGSQRLPEIMPRDVGIRVETGQEAVSGEDYGNLYEPYMERLIERRGLEPAYATIRRGQALVWATNTLHRGTPIRDASRTRHSQVTHYFFEGSRLWSPLLSNEEHTAWREAPTIKRRRRLRRRTRPASQARRVAAPQPATPGVSLLHGPSSRLPARQQPSGGRAGTPALS